MREAGRQHVCDYIEMFCNPKREHARNLMLSPTEFKRQGYEARSRLKTWAIQPLRSAELSIRHCSISKE